MSLLMMVQRKLGRVPRLLQRRGLQVIIKQLKINLLNYKLILLWILARWQKLKKINCINQIKVLNLKLLKIWKIYQIFKMWMYKNKIQGLFNIKIVMAIVLKIMSVRENTINYKRIKANKILPLHYLCPLWDLKLLYQVLSIEQ
jgi:hypothetical protein